MTTDSLLLIDGEQYFSAWFDSVATVRNARAAGDTQALLKHLAWRLSSVRRDGVASSGPSALSELVALQKRQQGSVRVLLSAHAFGLANRVAKARLGSSAKLERRFPRLSGSLHAKASIFKTSSESWAIIGSADLAPARWNIGHVRYSARRYRSRNFPSHDVGVLLRGQIVDHVEEFFDDCWGEGTINRAPLSPSSAMQLVENVPVASNVRRQTSSTYLDSLLKLIDNSVSFIYLEDQFFLPDFRDTRRGQGVPRQRSIVERLEAALDRGVCLIVMLPTPSRAYGHPSPWRSPNEFRRDRALARLQANPDHRERVWILHYSAADGRSTYVHSKLALADDRTMIVGSGNLNRRSLMSDVELGVELSDPLFVASSRRRLFEEHFGDGLFQGAATANDVQRSLQLTSTIGVRLQRVSIARPPASHVGPVQSFLADHLWDPVPPLRHGY